jgi:hypothetical protein
LCARSDYSVSGGIYAVVGLGEAKLPETPLSAAVGHVCGRQRPKWKRNNKERTMDNTLHAIYADMTAAERAAMRLAAAGVPQDAILMFGSGAERHAGGFGDSGAHMHDAQRDHVGSFADSGAHMHDAQRDHVGGFADSGAHMHDAQRDHVGSFGDMTKVADDLANAGLTRDAAQAAASRLAGGAVAVVVRATGATAEQVAQILNGE